MLAEKIIAGTLKEHQTVQIDYNEKKFVVS